jgi:hypothetical protein
MEKSEMNPVVTWVIIGVVVLVAVIVGFKVLGGPQAGAFQKGGSEEYQKKVESGQPLYSPPAAAFPPGGGPNAGTQPRTPTGPPGK